MSQGGGTVLHQVGLLDMTCCGREANSCLEVLWTTPMDDYSSPLSETLRIGYLDTRRVGHCCLAHGTAPFAFRQSRGNPSAPGVNHSKQHSIGYLLRSFAPAPSKRGYTADETACPSEGQSWFPRLVPPTGFTLGQCLV